MMLNENTVRKIANPGQTDNHGCSIMWIRASAPSMKPHEAAGGWIP